MAATDTASADAAAKARIIKHLNADHQDSLSFYLQHFNSLSSFEARNTTLTDITFNYLTLRTGGGNTSTIPLYPPMTAWSEARVRSVELDRTARTALGISNIRLDRYIPPTSPIHITIFGLCLLALLSFTTWPFITPGSFVYENVLCFFPGGPEWFLWISKMIAWPTLGIHIVETFLLDQKRLYKYGVQRGSAIWWKWIGSAFIEGYGTFMRIDAEVAKKEKEAAKAKH